MNRYLPSALALALGLAAATGALAQTPPAQDTTPQSSSTPAETPPANGAEPSSASSPHQRQATADGKAAHEQMMKDCIAKEQAANANTTASQAKKTCKEQMKTDASKKNY
jgi:hypothetical protein